MRHAYWILLLPPLFWSGNFVVGRAIAGQAPAIGLSFWRWFLAAIILLPFILKPIWQQRQIIWENIGPILLLSVTGVSAFNTLAYIGLQTTTATNGTLLNSLIPIFIVIISSAFFRSPASKQQIIGIVISFVGVLIILSEMSIQSLWSLSFNQGDLWILLAGLDWALYSVLLKHYRPPQLFNSSLLGVTVILGCLLLFPLYLLNPLNEQPFKLNNDVVWVLIYIAIFPSIIAYFAWNYGISKVGANIGGQFIHLMPLFGALLAMIFLGESLYIFHLMGGILIAIGLILSLNLWPRHD